MGSPRQVAAVVCLEAAAVGSQGRVGDGGGAVVEEVEVEMEMEMEVNGRDGREGAMKSHTPQVCDLNSVIGGGGVVQGFVRSGGRCKWLAERPSSG